MLPTPAPPPAGCQPVFQRYWTRWLMIAVLLLVAAIRIRLLNFPLERDEGEYAYAGQLILQGIPPYELAYNMKFPGTYLAYAAIMAVFGQTPAGIHFGILLMTTATALMLFWLGKKILDETAGIVAASSYALLAASPSMLGLAGHATHFCAFFVTAGLCLMWRARRDENWLLLAGSGALFGTAVLMKQQAVVISAWAGLSFSAGKLFYAKEGFGKRIGSTAVYGLSMLAPLAVCCLWLWHAGVFAAFKFWTFDYARQYEDLSTVSDGWVRFKLAFPLAAATTAALWLFALSGMIMLAGETRLCGSRFWLAGFGVSSALATVPGFYFRPHYFLVALPATALFSGLAVSAAGNWLQKNRGDTPRRWVVAIYFLFLGVAVWNNREIWLRATPIEAARLAYGLDPLPEAQATAEFIASHTAADDPVGILGSDPEIYFLSNRHSATGYIYTYALTEKQPFAGQMQRQFVAEISRRSPEIIVCCGDFLRWMNGGGVNSPVAIWWTHYRKQFEMIKSFEPPAFVGSTSMKGSFGFEVYQRKPRS